MDSDSEETRGKGSARPSFNTLVPGASGPSFSSGGGGFNPVDDYVGGFNTGNDGGLGLFGQNEEEEEENNGQRGGGFGFHHEDGNESRLNMHDHVHDHALANGGDGRLIMYHGSGEFGRGSSGGLFDGPSWTLD